MTTMGAGNTDDMVKVVFKLEKDEDDYPPADYGSSVLSVG